MSNKFSLVKSMLKLGLIGAIAITIFTGCGASKFSEMKRQDIKKTMVKGKTTSTDIEKLFGEPNGVEMTILQDAMTKLGISQNAMGGILDTMLNYQTKLVKVQRGDDEKTTDIDPELAKQEVELWTYSESSSESGASAISYVPIVGAFAGGVKSTKKTKILKMIFNEDGVLMEYRYSNSNKKSSHGYGIM